MIFKNLGVLNNALLRAAKVILENQAATSVSTPYAVFYAIAMSYVDSAMAITFLEKTLLQKETSLPLQGAALFHLYRYAKDKQAIKSKLPVWYESILQQHRVWYELNDPQEEGLPYTGAKLQDPLFLGLLVWSNENLMQVGHLINADVLEIIQWNELTIFGVNEKLWNAAQHCYQPFDQIQNHLIEADFCSRFAPLVGEIPTQDRAELLLLVIQRVIKKAERINLLEWWLLWCGLLRYDFVDLAAQIRQKMLQSVRAYGFYENFDAKNGEPFPSEMGQSALAAALTIDLLKRC